MQFSATARLALVCALLSTAALADEKATPPAPTATPAATAASAPAPHGVFLTSDLKAIVDVCSKGGALGSEADLYVISYAGEDELKELISGRYGTLSIQQLSQCKMSDDLPPTVLFTAAQSCNVNLLKSFVSLGANPWQPYDHYLHGKSHTTGDLALYWASRSDNKFAQQKEDLDELKDMYATSSSLNDKYGYCINVPKDDEQVEKWATYYVTNDDGQPIIDEKGNFLICMDKKETFDKTLADNTQAIGADLSACDSTIDYLITLLDAKPAQK